MLAIGGYLIAVIAALTLLSAHPAAGANEPVPCYEVVDLNTVAMTCEHTLQSIQAAQSGEPGSVWKVYQLCKDGTSGEPEACASPRACTIDGQIGTLYAVFKDGVPEGVACLSAGEPGAIEEPPVRVLVIAAFETLDWAPSELVVQPPGGKSLVNLDTNFYTTNSDSVTINVRLLGRSVAVTARPVAYEWHFGDGTSETTASPGAPYPDLDVSHVYDKTDKVVVSVDTQYGDASFSVNGGPAEAIPSTLWVDGAEEDLEIVEALPQLVVR